MKLKSRKSVFLFIFCASFLFFVTCLFVLPYTGLVYYKSYRFIPSIETLEKYHGACIDPCSMDSNLVYHGRWAQRHSGPKFVFYINRSDALKLKKELPLMKTCLKKTNLCL